MSIISSDTQDIQGPPVATHDIYYGIIMSSLHRKTMKKMLGKLHIIINNTHCTVYILWPQICRVQNVQ